MGTQRLDFAEFYRESKDACLFSVLVNVGDRDVAQDLVDEAFARAWASWRSVGRHPAPAAWVVRAALNASISRWRHRRREVSLPDPGTVADLAAGPGAADSTLDPRIMAALTLPGLVGALVLVAAAAVAVTALATGSPAAPPRRCPARGLDSRQAARRRYPCQYRQAAGPRRAAAQTPRRRRPRQHRHQPSGSVSAVPRQQRSAAQGLPRLVPAGASAAPQRHSDPPFGLSKRHRRTARWQLPEQCARGRRRRAHPGVRQPAVHWKLTWRSRRFGHANQLAGRGPGASRTGPACSCL
jgi:hypothetical protein